MLLQRSKLAAANVKRPRLAPPWLVVMLGGMVTGVLVASYPREDLIKRVLAAPPDELTEAYLVNLLRTDPQNPSLRLVLARSQMQAGLFDRVGATLAPSLASLRAMERPMPRPDPVMRATLPSSFLLMMLFLILV